MGDWTSLSTVDSAKSIGSNVGFGSFWRVFTSMGCLMSFASLLYIYTSQFANIDSVMAYTTRDFLIGEALAGYSKYSMEAESEMDKLYGPISRSCGIFNTIIKECENAVGLRDIEDFKCMVISVHVEYDDDSNKRPLCYPTKDNDMCDLLECLPQKLEVKLIVSRFNSSASSNLSRAVAGFVTLDKVRRSEYLYRYSYNIIGTKGYSEPSIFPASALVIWMLLLSFFMLNLDYLISWLHWLLHLPQSVCTLLYGKTKKSQLLSILLDPSGMRIADSPLGAIVMNNLALLCLFTGVISSTAQVLFFNSGDMLHDPAKKHEIISLYSAVLLTESTLFEKWGCLILNILAKSKWVAGYMFFLCLQVCYYLLGNMQVLENIAAAIVLSGSQFAQFIVILAVFQFSCTVLFYYTFGSSHYHFSTLVLANQTLVQYFLELDNNIFYTQGQLSEQAKMYLGTWLLIFKCVACLIAVNIGLTLIMQALEGILEYPHRLNTVTTQLRDWVHEKASVVTKNQIQRKGQEMLEIYGWSPFDVLAENHIPQGRQREEEQLVHTIRTDESSYYDTDSNVYPLRQYGT